MNYRRLVVMDGTNHVPHSGGRGEEGDKPRAILFPNATFNPVPVEAEALG
jgi:hypothetical protein